MTTLEFKPDWDETRERLERWWRVESTDRPVVVIRVEKHGANAPQFAPADPDSAWLDQDQVLAQVEAQCARTLFLGESFPYLCASLGPGSFGTFVGAKPKFAPGTVWYEPAGDSIASLDIALDEGNQWWQWTLETTRMLVQAGRGRYVTSMPDMIENLDTIAALVGAEKTLFELVENPEEVHKLQSKLNACWFKAFDALYELIEFEGGNAFTAFSIWGPGKTAKLQCDISAMISEEMFREFFMPYFREQTEFLDYSLYHLDGPDAVHHLDALMEAPKLNALQWMPGAGVHSGGDPRWDAIYRKVLDSGKSIQAHMTPGETQDFVRRFGAKGVMVIVEGRFSESEARQLIDEVKIV